MAAIENLEIIVDVDIASAIADLKKLQEELKDVAEAISMADARGTEGIDIDTEVHGVDREIAQAMAKIEAAEAMMSFDIPANVRPALPAPGGPAGALPAPQIAGALPAPTGGPGGMNRRIIPGRVRNFARSLRKATNAADNFDLRMSDMHNLLAALIPVLIVFLGTLPAVITALVGLAGAALAAAASLAAIVGFGAMGVALEDGQFNMDNLTEVWEDIRTEFIDAFAPLAERLEPLFMDGIDALGRFFQEIANQGDALMELTDEARAFGGFIMDFFPSALRTLASLVEALAPMLGDIGKAIENNFNDWVRELVRLTARAIDPVSALIQKILASIPTLVEIGSQFAVVATMVLDFIGVLWTVITVGGLFDNIIGTAIASMLVLATAISLANKALIGFIVRGIWTAARALQSYMVSAYMATSATTLFGSTALASAVSSLIAFTASIIQSAVALVGFSLSAFQAAAAAAAFWTAVTLGGAIFLVGIVAGLATEFMGLSSRIDQATSSLKEFDRVSGRTKGGFNPYGGDPPSSGAGAASGGSGSQTVINVESSGDAQDDRSNARYVSFRQGRTTGGNN